MRVRPLRNSRNYWKIPLYCYHECTDMCSTIITYSSDLTIEIKDNTEYDYTTGKCQDYHKLCRASINISSYDGSKPYSTNGKLYYPDIVIIPDQCFSILLTFPFVNEIEVSVQLTSKITLRQILTLIKQIYQYIYEEEERTAPPTEFTISRPCLDCSDTDLKDTLRKLTVSESKNEKEEDCSICYLPFDKETIVLGCKHKFHMNCMNTWVDKGGTNCPLCRAPVDKCESCNDEKFIRTTEEHVVLPRNLRYPTSLRNNTNGSFGIYGYDIDNLYITEMWYSRTNKLLQVCVQQNS